MVEAKLSDIQPLLLKNNLELDQDESGYVLRDSEGRNLQINFDKNKADYFRRNLSIKNDLLSKALGISKGNRRVLELSSGLGIDSVHISSLGAELTSIERNPIIYFLLIEAQKKSARQEVKRIQFLYQDALEYLKSLKPNSFDVVYFDPMYPQKKKSALPKQEMLVFRGLVGDDLDAQKVLLAALEKFKRVVIKRPVIAGPLLSPVTHSFEGKSVRFDIYSKV